MLVMLGILLMTCPYELAEVLGVGRAIRLDGKAPIGQSRHVLLVLVGRFDTKFVNRQISYHNKEWAVLDLARTTSS